MKMNLDLAQQLLSACLEAAAERGHKMVVAVADEHGDLLAFAKMDGALLVSTEIAINKAFTVVALRMPTAQFGELVQPGRDLFGMNTTHAGRLVTLGGGLPLVHNDLVIGGIGVSGGSALEDAEVAEAAVNYFAAMQN